MKQPRCYRLLFNIFVLCMPILSAFGGVSTKNVYPVCVTSLGEDLCLNGGGCVEDKGNVSCTCPSDFFGLRCEHRKCPVINPCYNDGLCEKTADSFACHCKAGYGGRYCEQKLSTICDTQPCRNGKCTITHSVNEYKCECLYGFSGANCSDVDYCLGNHCLHGDCVNTPQGHKCNCKAGWQGNNCTEDINECKWNPCKNGKCVNVAGDYICRCADGFGGKNCEVDDAGICHVDLCLNGGNCPKESAKNALSSATKKSHSDKSNDASVWLAITSLFTSSNSKGHNSTTTQIDGFQCDCPIGFFGGRCEERVDECVLNDFALDLAQNFVNGDEGPADWWENVMCINGGVCVGHGGSTRDELISEAVDLGLTSRMLGATCKCPPGFTGDHCEKDVDECARDGVCLNGGTCFNNFGSYRCLCVGGFNGTHCETNIDDCVDNICYPGSTCVDGISRYDCICEEGRIGMLCENEDLCYGDRNACVHGQCYMDFMTGNYGCTCDEGFHGVNCDEDINECEQYPNLCRPNGKCMNTVGSYYCQYSPNCSLNLCQHDSFCLDYSNDYECICLPGYVGRNCEKVKSSTCDLHCFNDGICRKSDDLSTEFCECPPQYKGLYCEIVSNLTACEAHDCQNNGTCEFSSNTSLSYVCKCPLGFGGEKCDQKLALCDGNECNLETTSLAPIYTSEKTNESGEIFPLPTDCRTKPCHNNGSCSFDMLASGEKFFKCECFSGFAGPFCELDVNECLAEPCQNKGRCVDLINDFRCDCVLGFVGERCEVNVDECRNVKCLHGGRCVDEVNAFTCECADGFMGKYCEVDLKKYERKDVEQSDSCSAKSCAEKAHNGKCDMECNFYACEFDGGECAMQNARPFKQCGKERESYCAHAFGNGKCDEICNVEECLFDAFDCMIGKNHSIPSPSDGKFGKKILSGELSLIILKDEMEFFRDARRFLVELSAHLRASIRIAVDAVGRVKIYRWRSDLGADETEPVPLPENVSVESLSVVYPENVAQRTRRNVLENKRIGDVTKGVKILLEIDVSMCTSLDGFLCFSNIESIPQFLGADSANQLLGPLNEMKIHKAEAVVKSSDEKPARRTSFEVILISVFVFLMCIVFVVSTRSRRKFVSAPTWRPKKLVQNSKNNCLMIGDAKAASYRAFRNSSMTNTAPYSNLSSASNSNGNLAAVPHLHQRVTAQTISNGMLPMLNDGSDGKSTLLLYPQPFNNHLTSLNSLSSHLDPMNGCFNGYMENGSLRSLVHHGNNEAIYSVQNVPQTILPSGYGNNGSQKNSYCSSSSGVSSGQNSPLNEATFDHQNQVIGHQNFSLHIQAASSSGILEPVDSSLVNLKDSEGKTPIHVLCDFGNFERTVCQITESIDRLLAAGADINAQDYDGTSSLILAIKSGRAEVVMRLLDRGADVNLMDFEERAPLHYAIQCLSPLVIFQRLLACADLDLNTVESRKETPLMLCAKLVNCALALDMARHLVENGADVNRTADRDLVDFNGQTALHVAASVNNVEIIRLLIDHKANKDAKDLQERTPLCLAALNGHSNAVNVLLFLGADKFQCDIDERSPMDLALENNFGEIFKILDTFSPPTPSAIGSSMVATSQPGNNKMGSNSSSSRGTSNASAIGSPPFLVADKNDELAPRIGAKRGRNAPVTKREAGIKACKAKRISPSYALPTANNLMTLTPPNSDQSTIYSTTPSPNNAGNNGGPAAEFVSHPSTSQGYTSSTGGGQYPPLTIPLTMMSNMATQENNGYGNRLVNQNGVQNGHYRLPSASSQHNSSRAINHMPFNGNGGDFFDGVRNCGNSFAYDVLSPSSIYDRTPPPPMATAAPTSNYLEGAASGAGESRGQRMTGAGEPGFYPTHNTINYQRHGQTKPITPGYDLQFGSQSTLNYDFDQYSLH